MVGQVITTAISALTIIWITRVLGQTSYGEYTVALVPVSLLLLFQDLGVNSALMRFCAMYRHEGKEGLRSVVMTGVFFSGFTSLIMSLLLFSFSEPVASLYLQRPEVAPLVQVAALSILGQGLLSTVQAILAGYELMTLRSVTQIIYSIVRGIVGVALVLIGFGSYGAMLSYTFALLFSSFSGVLIVLFFIKFKDIGGANLRMLKELLTFGFPLSISSILGGLLTQLFNSLMLLYSTTEMIGNYGAAANFGVLVSFLTVPIATVLFPLFSKFKRHDVELQNIYRASVKYTSMITLPVVLVIIVLAAQVSRVIFTTDYPLVPLYLSLYILTYSFEGLGGISLSNLISGIGESQVTLRSSIITTCFGAVLAFTLIPSYQMVGLLVAMILAPRAGWVYQTLWAKKNLGIFIDVNSTIRLYFSGFAAFAVSYLLVNGLVLHGWVAIISGGFTLLVVYLLMLLLSGALKRHDVEQIDSMVDNMGPLTPVLKRLVAFVGQFTRS